MFPEVPYSFVMLFVPGLTEILAEIIAICKNVIFETHGNSRYTVPRKGPVSEDDRGILPARKAVHGAISELWENKGNAIFASSRGALLPRYGEHPFLALDCLDALLARYIFSLRRKTRKYDFWSSPKMALPGFYDHRSLSKPLENSLASQTSRL